MTNTMASAISTPTTSLLHSSSSPTGEKPSRFVPSNSATSSTKIAIFQHVKGIPQLGFVPFSQFLGLKQLGTSVSQYAVKIERKGKCKGRGVHASLFGVGAPEALIIGVVALLVFGPKGLAEVARNLGKTLRAFQPTIRELQDVSREFKSSLEREIGLDEINNSVPTSFSSDALRPGRNVEPNTSSENNEVSPSASREYSADEYLKVTEAQVARMQKEQQESPSLVLSPSENPAGNALQEEASSAVPAPRPDQNEK